MKEQHKRLFIAAEVCFIFGLVYDLCDAFALSHGWENYFENLFSILLEK